MALSYYSCPDGGPGSDQSDEPVRNKGRWSFKNYMPRSMPISLSTILLLPFLVLIAIPLAISAYITICISVVALCVRLSVVYVELIFAVVINYFSIPTSNNSSMLNFAASMPTTPAALATPKRRSLDHGMAVSFTTPPVHRQTSQSQSRSDSTRPRLRSNSYDEQGEQEMAYFGGDGGQSNGMRGSLATNAQYHPPTAFLGLTSGDEGRDFEGLGGWRCAARGSGYVSGSASPTSNDSVSDEADERAWLSINQRLELPSQPLTLGNSYDSSEQLHCRRRHAGPGSPGNHHRRHHHRSATTSEIPSLGIRNSHALSLSLSKRPDPHALENRHHRASFDLPSATAYPLQSSARLSSSVDGSGGYFALRRNSGESSTTSGSTTPADDRLSPRAMGRSMAHYPTSVRYRRSTPGPNSGSRLRRPSDIDRSM